jgi:serine/threonine-protein kinase
METQQFSNGPWVEFDDDAVTVVVDHKATDLRGRSVDRRLDDEASPPTQRSIEITSSGPSRPFSRTMIGSGVHNPEAERAAVVRHGADPGSRIADEPSPVPWAHEEPRPEVANDGTAIAAQPRPIATPGLPVAPLPKAFASTHRPRGQVVPAAPSRPVVIRTPSPRPPPPASATPNAMAIDLPPGVRERAARELMGGPPSVLRGRNRASAILAAASLVITVLLGLVLLVPRTGQLRVAATLDKGRIERADVYVDGTKRCDAVPCLVRELSRGQHVVEIRASGYHAASRREIVALGKERLALVPMRPVVALATLRASAPQGVHVFVDGIDRGALPADLGDLTPGEHRVRFAGPGLEVPEQTVALGAGEVRDFGVVHAAPPKE